MVTFRLIGSEFPNPLSIGDPSGVQGHHCPPKRQGNEVAVKPPVSWCECVVSDCRLVQRGVDKAVDFD